MGNTRKALVLLLGLWAVGQAQAATPATRTWTITVNQSVPNTLTHTEQFQEEFFQLKQLIEDSGATIERSNGGGTASAADNLPDRTAVTLGAAGSGAWYVAGWSNLGGAAVRCLIAVDDASDPRQQIEYRCGNATWTGGTTSALPTVNTGFAFATVDISGFMPYTSVQNAYWNSWRSTNASGAQSIRFLYKQAGSVCTSGSVCTLFVVEGNTNADGGGTVAVERWAVGSISQFSSAAFQNSAWLNGLTPAGSALETKLTAASIWSIGASWTSGINVAGNQTTQGLLIGTQAASGRTLGVWVDVHALPQLAVQGVYTDSTESAQNPRRMNFGPVSFYWPLATSVL